MNRLKASARKSPAKTRAGIAIIVMILLLAFAIAVFSRGQSSSSLPFGYQLYIDPVNGTVRQGTQILTHINISIIQGTPEKVALTASSNPNGIEFNFSSQTGKPSMDEPWISNLSITVPAETPSDIYSVNISSTAANGKTYSNSLTLTVVNSEIQVSGTVNLRSHDSIWPSEIQFVNTSTNATYTAIVDLHIHFPFRAITQQGTYSISLPNQQSYRVICLWDGLFGPGPLPFPLTTGTFDFGTLEVNGGVGITSITQDYTG